MDFAITFQDGTGPADVEVTLSGVPSLADLWDFRDAFEKDARFRAGLTLLVDISGLTASSVPASDLAELGARIVASDWDARPLAVAIVAPHPELFNAARAYRAYVGGSKSNRHVVSSRAEALAWLEEQRRSV